MNLNIGWIKTIPSPADRQRLKWTDTSCECRQIESDQQVKLLDLRAHVRGEDVAFAVWASLSPQNVPTWMTAWALRMALPQNPTVLDSAETIGAFIWGEVILLSPILNPALTMYQGSRLTLMSPGTGLFKQLLVKLCKSWGRRPGEANSGLLSFRQQYPELTQRRRSVSSCQGKAMKKRSRKWKCEECLREP